MAEKTTDKISNLDLAISQIEKQFGKGAIMKLGEAPIQKVEVIPTGCLSLDLALGIGGVPKGRIIEIFGPESSGKTTVSLHILAECQKAGGIAAFIDAEHALDPIYAEKLGVNISELYVSQPDNGEQALEICEELVKSGAVDLIVIDSVAALTPKAEINGEMGDSHMGLQARLMSQALRKITAMTSKSNTCIIFINQLREKLNTMGFGGTPETTTGGKALKFYASLRLDVRKIESLKDSSNQVYASKTRVKVVKNKLAPPFKVADFEIVFGKGISKEGNVLDLAVENDIIQKTGSWYSYQGNKIAQGRESAKNYLITNQEIYKEIEEKLREVLSLN